MKVSFLLFFFISTIDLAAQNRIAADPNALSRYEGKIVDALSGDPLVAAVKVCIRSSQRCVQADTNALGEFAIDVAASGMDSLDITPIKVGYIERRGEEEKLRVRVGRLSLPAVLRLLAMSRVSGRVIDADGNSIRAFITFRSTRGIRRYESILAKDGQFEKLLVPGFYRICAARDYPQPALPVSTVTYPTCLSSPVEIKSGDSITLPDMQLSEGPAFSIRGKVTTLVGKTANWSELVFASSEEEVGAQRYRASVDPKTGEFAIHGLRSARYALMARAGQTPESDVHPWMPSYSDWQNVDVGPRTSPILFAFRPNVTVNLRMLLDEMPDASLRSSLLAILPDSLQPNIKAESVGVGEERLEGIAPGTYRILTRDWDENSYVVGVRQDGNDISGKEINIPEGRSTDLEVRFARPKGFVHINVPTKLVDGQLLQALLIPEDAWENPGVWHTSANPRVFKGVFTKEWLAGPYPPGSYFVLVLETPVPSDDEVRIHRSSAAHVVIADGDIPTIVASPIALESWPPFK